MRRTQAGRMRAVPMAPQPVPGRFSNFFLHAFLIPIPGVMDPITQAFKTALSVSELSRECVRC